MKLNESIKLDVTGPTPLLVCPVCGQTNVHPTVVECLPPGTDKGIVVITSDGLEVTPNVPPDNRGVRITLQFGCESGHEFAFQFHFHKGVTAVRRMARTPSRGSRQTRPIWRD